MRRGLERRLDPACGLHHRMHMVERRNVLVPLDLRHEDPRERKPGDCREIVVVAGVHTYIDGLFARLAEQVGQVRARLGLRRRRHTVLEVDDDRVCTRCDRLHDAVGPVGRTNSQVRVGAVRRSVPIAVAEARRRRSRSQRARPQYGRRARPERTASPHRRRRLSRDCRWTCPDRRRAEFDPGRLHFFDVGSGARLDPEGARRPSSSPTR